MIEFNNLYFIVLKEISEDVGLSYNIIADISSNRKKNHAYKNFKYQPQIDIKRINKNVKNVKKENLIIDDNEDY